MLSFKITSRKIWKEIERSKRILLHIHPGPDGDSVGSSLAFYHVLKNMGKEVCLIQGDNEFPKKFSSMPGADKIIHQNILQIDLSQFDLFIINDSSSVKQITKMGDLKFPKKLKTIIIDHHISSEKFADINLISPKSTSTCQVLFELFQINKVKLTSKIAACLFVGLYTDTGGFRYFNPTYKTFDIASKLAKLYPKFSQLIFDIENNDDPDRIKFLSLLLSSVETFYSDHVAVASISYNNIQSSGLNSSSVSSYSEVPNMLKSVIGWDIAFSMVEVQPETVKISFRTRDSNKYDLAKIAVATNGGGGHKAAAGATINKSLPEAKQMVLDIIKKLYPKIEK